MDGIAPLDRYGAADMGQRLRDRIIPINVERLKRPGMHADGRGLYLRIGPNGAKSWIFRYRADGKRRDAGLGGYPAVSLAEAREKAEALRRQRAAGRDPLELREAEKQTAKLETARRMTFKQCAEAYIETHKATWKNAKHAYQWPQSLGAFVYPVFGDLPVQAVDAALVIQALKPIWRMKTETAARTRGRIERVLDWAKASGFRTGENPARWRGHLDQLLPQPSKIATVEHHAALPYAEMGEFMRLLRQQEGTAARALEFTILCATRTSETLLAIWTEIDFAAEVWTIPPERMKGRMKGGREHRVPLPPAALDLLKALHAAAEAPRKSEAKAAASPGQFIFPGARRGKPLSNMAMLQLLRRLGRGDLTSHGFRSTFKDWGREQTNFPREVIEAALAHALESKVEAAYARGDLLQKRRKLMEAWAGYCEREDDATGTVVPITKARRG
jgi:integrase